jgi:multisubunit Na+/H+ antiporter MnhE subunit
MSYLRAILGLTAVYLALTSNLQVSNIIMGVIVSSLILLILRPQSRPVAWRSLPQTVLAGLRYSVVLIYDLALSSVQVGRVVLDPALPLQQGNFAIPTECDAVAAQALSAHAITLTPGEMVVEMDEDGTMYTHALDVSDAPQRVAAAQAMRDELLGKIAP